MVESRQRARALIMGGKVRVAGEIAEKPGKEFAVDAEISITEPIPFVSRGGIKLNAALDAFGLDPSGLTVLDVGASTGGFTDCLLQRGAARVIALDVGYGLLHWKLRNDPRVSVVERTNFRLFDPLRLPHPVNAAVADLSFISLKLVLPKFSELLPAGAWLVPLVKPQFEVGRFDVGKGGVVRDPEKIRAAVAGIRTCAEQCGFDALGESESPIRGPKGNREFLLHLLRR
jgi:23S rRNA (cytidine1920-2'-O)/16S rRNA (cytidine1409-2'-O)-methyltransferase